MAEVNWLQPSNFRPAAVRALPGAASERMGRSAQAHERTGKAARQYTFEPRRADNDGTELTYKYKSLKLTGRNNYVSALMMVNAEMQKRLGKDRSQASIEEFRSVLDNLDDLLQTLVRRVRKAKSDYDKNQA